MDTVTPQPKLTVVASTETLMRLAADVGRAVRSGDAAEIQRANERLDAYREIYLAADKATVPTGVLR